MIRKQFFLAIVLSLACCASVAFAAVDRVVILKADGLPFDSVDEFVRKQDPYTGKSVLPWIEHVFYQRGTRLSNFYSRGLSLSASSWAVLDTGRPSVIKGNLEFDRLTLQPYDYLNAFTYVLKNSTGRKTQTPGVMVLDELHIPLLSDSYSPTERYVGLQLFGRGLPFAFGSLKRLLTLQNPKEWFDEWTIGMEGEPLLFEFLERDLVAKLSDSRIRYLDMVIPVFDHTAHIKREPEALLNALQQIDGIVRRVSIAIEQSPYAESTALVLVSDHGMNTSPTIYSQGYNLIDWFGSAAGGGHHVVTNRQPLGAYALKPPSPSLPPVTTPSSESFYLKGQSAAYPTLLLDADGNERASVYLRNSDLNTLQILWQQLQRIDLMPELRRAATQTFFDVVEQNRSDWTTLVTQLKEEIPALRRSSTSTSLKTDDVKYSAYVRTLETLLFLEPATFDPSRYKVEQVLAKSSVGPLNSIHNLQNYVVDLSDEGLVLGADGSLDTKRSFRRIDYFTLLREVKTRNNVQPAVASEPVDFLATTAPVERIRAAFPEDSFPIDNVIWLFRDAERQALILSHQVADGTLWLRYVPVRHLIQSADGQIHFAISSWRDKLPLEVWESLTVAPERRQEWLEGWHTEADWFDATHAGKYSNAVISLYEQFSFSTSTPTDDVLVNRFLARKRRLAQADFIVFANDHWNFNYRGFNPGGNHGAFFRPSTHATLMFAGGTTTLIPQGMEVREPYDTLSFVPTILSLTGRVLPNGSTPLPGPIIRELK